MGSKRASNQGVPWLRISGESNGRKLIQVLDEEIYDIVQKGLEENGLA